MKARPLYLIDGSAGSWEDHHTWTVKAYLDRERAEAECLRMREALASVVDGWPRTPDVDIATDDEAADAAWDKWEVDLAAALESLRERLGDHRVEDPIDQSYAVCETVLVEEP